MANETEIEAINKMTHEEMAKLWRFGSSDHPYFRDGLFDIFKSRFDELGGMTPEISKKIGL
jgi:hypothetical protein